MKYHLALQYARQNRSNQTPAETIFWNKVRDQRFKHLKFYRQHVIGYKLSDLESTSYFIVDFYCHSLNLIIELDGRIHDYQKEYDNYRAEILKGLDFDIIRFTNAEVLDDWKYVDDKLTEIFNANLR